MKRSLILVFIILASGALGWTLGFLRLPYMEKNYSFWMGFLACLSLLSLVLLILFFWKKNIAFLNWIKGKSNATASNSFTKSHWIIWMFFSGIVLVGSLVSGVFIYQQNKFSQHQIKEQDEKIAHQMELMEATRSSNMIILLNELMDKINAEIQEHPENKLSNSTIEKITILNQSFEPYLYLESDSMSIKRLSLERGQLLLSLARSKMDSTSFALIKSKVSFLGADLRNKNLSGTDLNGIDLRESDLSNSDLNGANLTNADLRSSNFWGANLNKAMLNHADLKRANLRWIEANDSSWENADLDDVRMNAAKLRRANFSNTKIRWSHLQNTFLNEANFSNADLLATYLNNANMENVKLGGASLRLAILFDTNLKGADLAKIEKLEKAIVKEENWFEKLNDWSVIGATELSQNYTTTKYNKPPYGYTVAEKNPKN